VTVVTGMISNPTAQASTALSPEWDRGFDAAFADLISSDAELVRAEFDALIGNCFNEPPAPPRPPRPSAGRPAPPHPGPAPSEPPNRPATHQTGAISNDPRSPP